MRTNSPHGFAYLQPEIIHTLLLLVRPDVGDSEEIHTRARIEFNEVANFANIPDELRPFGPTLKDIVEEVIQHSLKTERAVRAKVFLALRSSNTETVISFTWPPRAFGGNNTASREYWIGPSQWYDKVAYYNYHSDE